MTNLNLKKMAISICVVGLIGSQVNAYEPPHSNNYQTKEINIGLSKNADIKAIKAMIKELEDKINNLPREIEEAKREITKIENDLNMINKVIAKHLAVTKSCSNPILNESARNICNRYSILTQDGLLKKYKTKVQELLDRAKAKRDELITDSHNIPFFKEARDALISRFNLYKMFD